MENLTQVFEQKPDTSDQKPVTHQKTGLSLTAVILIIIFLSIASFGGYQIYQRSNLNKQIETAKTELEALKEADFSDNQAITTNLKANFLSQKQAERIFWTNALFNLESSITEPNKIQITNITGSDNGNINVTANTTSFSNDPFIDTANLITVLKTKSFFDQIFIPSINSTVTQGGVGQLNYTLRLNYKKDLEQEKSALSPDEVTTTNSATTPEVPSLTADPNVLEELRQRLNTPTNE